MDTTVEKRDRASISPLRDLAEGRSQVVNGRSVAEVLVEMRHEQRASAERARDGETP